MEFVDASRVLTPRGWSGPCRVWTDGGLIVGVDDIDSAPERTLSPGFVDLQVNGIDTIDVATADGDDWAALDSALLRQGTTSWCPTVITAPMESYGPCLDRIGIAMRRGGATVRPQMLGVHLEGPFLGGAPGAHRKDRLRPIDLEFLASLPAHVRLVTLAPELENAVSAVAALVTSGHVVSLGHTTARSAAVEAAVAAGASMVTHLFNAMSGVHHRDDGVALFALTDDRIVAGLIADGVHVQRRAIQLAFTAKGGGGVALVTDAVAWRAATASAKGIHLRDGAPRLEDGTLAGSALTMDAAVRNCVAAGVDLADALSAASTTPARVAGAHDRGVIAPGHRADLVALDDRLEVTDVWVAGRRART